MVNVPSGFDHVDDVSVRIDSTSTREPCARALTAAETTSGRASTRAAVAGGGASGAATATTGATTSVVLSTNATDAAYETILVANDLDLREKNNLGDDTNPPLWQNRRAHSDITYRRRHGLTRMEAREIPSHGKDAEPRWRVIDRNSGGPCASPKAHEDYGSPPRDARRSGSHLILGGVLMSNNLPFE
ncbi:hypothetical protein [Lentzea jiangxiensis]|uniref:hypothetical protein n=1 Tax=Lentzea jiangxiensis TaxID=641025 RepID=UPI001C40B45C|nr:hypothetical protein [Lentzea jiangxiensis]